MKCDCCVIILNYCRQVLSSSICKQLFIYTYQHARTRYQFYGLKTKGPNHGNKIKTKFLVSSLRKKIRTWNSSWTEQGVVAAESKKSFFKGQQFIYGWINNFICSQRLPVIFTISDHLWQLAITRKFVSYDFKLRCRVYCCIVSRVVWIHSCRCCTILPLVIIGNYFYI